MVCAGLLHIQDSSGDLGKFGLLVLAAEQMG